ncbi:undecaprenyl-phosphate glucose phosphotransferase [Pontibacter sp. MBLB2868]|uniref:undecaprenyl-phosphate glucose phosphotransferase n=1 Tax=Pontibacter sp. MBLB2868 TaxID=3451555 RepID=UPI003F74D564
MPGLYSKYNRLIHVIGDAVVLSGVSVGTYFLSVKYDILLPFSFFIKFSLFTILAWFVCSSLSGAYKLHRITNLLRTTFNVSKVIILYILLVEATLNILNLSQMPRQYLIYHYILLTVSMIFWRFLITKILREYRRRGYNYRNVIVVGCGTVSLEMRDFFKAHPEHGYHFFGFFDDNAEEHPEVLGKVDDVEDFVTKNGIDEIYCSPFEVEKHQLDRLTEFVDNNLVRMKLLPSPGEFPYKKLKIDFYDILPVLMLRSIPLDDAVNKFIKRAFDIAFSTFVIVFLLSWLLPIIAIIIKLDSRGPTFFRQERSGIDNKVFNCMKLRTMYVNSEANTHQARRGDSRITMVGAFLRKTSLDELPQFFNVFVGQMSVVGPRPHMLKHTAEYAATVDKFMVRHFVKPGITGLSQVRGFRGDTSELYQMRGRVKLDIFYLENWSFILDLKIIINTVLNVINGDDRAF